MVDGRRLVTLLWRSVLVLPLGRVMVVLPLLRTLDERVVTLGLL